MIPLAKNFVETRREGLVVDELGVLLSDLEGLGDQVRDIFSDEHVRVEVCRTNLLRKV